MDGYRDNETATLNQERDALVAERDRLRCRLTSAENKLAEMKDETNAVVLYGTMLVLASAVVALLIKGFALLAEDNGRLSAGYMAAGVALTIVLRFAFYRRSK